MINKPFTGLIHVWLNVDKRYLVLTIQLTLEDCKLVAINHNVFIATGNPDVLISTVENIVNVLFFDDFNSNWRQADYFLSWFNKFFEIIQDTKSQRDLYKHGGLSYVMGRTNTSHLKYMLSI